MRPSQQFYSLLIATVLVLSFQNCSKTQFTPEDGLVGKSASDRDPASDNGGKDGNSKDGKDGKDCKDKDCKNGDCKKDELEGLSSDSYYQSLCQQLRRSGNGGAALLGTEVHLQMGGELVGIRGHSIVSIVDATRVADIRGNLIMYAPEGESAAVVDLVEDVAGNVISCGVSIASLKKARGHVVVIDADVGPIDDVRGNFLIIRGNQTGNITNVRGHILRK